MIDSIELVNFQDLVECQSLAYQSKESFLQITYTFKKGNVYGLISDFGCGSWGLSTCLGGRCSPYYTGKILLNRVEVSAAKLLEHSCFITDRIFPGINTAKDFLTPKECIEIALSLSSQPYSVQQIKELFCLSDERFERSMDSVSGEIWLISMAVNFALGKEIFCYPWLNMIDINRFETANELGIIDLLKSTGKIVLVPSSQKKILRKHSEHTILFEKEKIISR